MPKHTMQFVFYLSTDITEKVTQHRKFFDNLYIFSIVFVHDKTIDYIKLIVWLNNL